ncbi:MAG: hypothetical protein NZ518_04015, partial [Dehalococcoidia bacterium]|nr:hypothetical protein [Dehalococcoidia bacterium]
MRITAPSRLRRWRLADLLRLDPTTTLLVTTFVTAGCALVYELLIGTLSSYLMGSSVFHYSFSIGLFMSALGVGAYVSRYCRSHLA